MQGTCGKCEGKKTIDAFGHYANGVCFACGGTGLVTYTPSEARAIEDTRRETAAKRAWLLSATDEALWALPWKKIYAVHEFTVASLVAGDAEIAALLPRVKRAFEAAL